MHFPEEHWYVHLPVPVLGVVLLCIAIYAWKSGK